MRRLGTMVGRSKQQEPATTGGRTGVRGNPATRQERKKCADRVCACGRRLSAGRHPLLSVVRRVGILSLLLTTELSYDAISIVSYSEISSLTETSSDISDLADTESNVRTSQ
jgi:hypothetical protein